MSSRWLKEKSKRIKAYVLSNTSLYLYTIRYIFELFLSVTFSNEASLIVCWVKQMWQTVSCGGSTASHNQTVWFMENLSFSLFVLLFFVILCSCFFPSELIWDQSFSVLYIYRRDNVSHSVIQRHIHELYLRIIC